MFKLSAFADEIDPDPQKQVEVLKQCGVRHIEFRSILKTNVLDLTDLQIREFKSLLDKNGFSLSAIGSPIGKIKITDAFEETYSRVYASSARSPELGFSFVLANRSKSDEDTPPFVLLVDFPVAVFCNLDTFCPSSHDVDAPILRLRRPLRFL